VTPQPVRINAETAEAIAAGMPACPNCGGRNVRTSKPIRVEDTVRAWFKYIPYRCRTCQHRFYKRIKAQQEAAG
jgi:hypothetical protein